VGLETGEWRRCRSLSFTPPASLRSHGSRLRPTRHSLNLPILLLCYLIVFSLYFQILISRVYVIRLVQWIAVKQKLYKFKFLIKSLMFLVELNWPAYCCIHFSSVEIHDNNKHNQIWRLYLTNWVQHHVLSKQCTVYNDVPVCKSLSSIVSFSWVRALLRVSRLSSVFILISGQFLVFLGLHRDEWIYSRREEKSFSMGSVMVSYTALSLIREIMLTDL